MKLLHSADWQLGAHFRQFGPIADELRRARFETLRRTLRLARERHVDALLISGDLFEDNGVDDSVVRDAVAIFAEHDDLPIFISPGNHDPYTGPGCVWERASFRKSPPTVRVFRNAEAAEFRGAFLLGAPLRQKRSTFDPSIGLVDLARTLPNDAIRIGLAHGSPDIPGLREDNDFPIARNAASRAELDFLGIGHWHSWLLEDEGRMLMPGTPEPDAFDRRDCGSVALVEIGARGAMPAIEKVPIATFEWHKLAFDFLDTENSRRSLQARLDSLAASAATSMIRVQLRGSARGDVLASVRQWAKDALAVFPFHQMQDESSLAINDSELSFLKGQHPILAQVLADLDQIEALKLGSRSVSTDPGHITLAETNRLFEAANMNATLFTRAHFDRARQIILRRLEEAQ